MNLIFCSTLPRVEEKAPRVEEPKFGGWSTRFGESRHCREEDPYLKFNSDLGSRIIPLKLSLNPAFYNGPS